jgi:hypothetical protein
LFDLEKLPDESYTTMTKKDYLNRLDACKKCPVLNGDICDPTRQRLHSFTQEPVNGCGCNIKVKRTIPEAGCPAGEWKTF